MSLPGTSEQWESRQDDEALIENEGEPAIAEAASPPAAPSSDTSTKHREHQQFRLLIGSVSVVGTIAAVVTGSLLISQVVQLLLVSVGISMAIRHILTLPLVVMGSCTIALLVLPRLLRDLRIPACVLASDWTRQWTQMPSLEHQLRLLRGLLTAAAVIPIVNLFARSALTRTHSPVLLETWFRWPNLICWVGCAIFLTLAAVVWYGFPRLYLKLRRDRIHRSLRHHHRGVALRSFIAAWDNPGRPIYTSCRLSRRISRVHRATFCVTTLCLSAAASCAASITGSYWLNELVFVIAIASLYITWPTPGRLVSWSAMLLDPFCDDPDDYEYV